MARMKIRMAIIFATAVFLMAAASGCGGKIQPGTADVKRPVVTGVTVRTVSLTPADEYYETSGTVTAKSVSQIAGKLMGRVTAVFVKEGERVTPGQLLLTLDDSDIAAKVSAARAGYEEAAKSLEIAKQNQALADTTYERYRRLYQHKAVTRQEMDQIQTQMQIDNLQRERAQAAVDQGQAELAQARVYEGYSRLTAPTGGIISAKKIDVGSMALPGVPLLVLEDTSGYRVEADVDEGLSGKISVGMPVEVLAAGMPAIAGTVTGVVPSIDPAVRKFHIKIALPVDTVQPGEYVRIRLIIGKKEAILLPKSSLVKKGELEGVYTVNADGIIVYRVVKIGRQYGKQVEIISGLSPRDKVIVDGLDKVVDGGVVKGGES
jgi:RND family efflux transporter MFP subunit